jgi:hypothetical protein
MGPKGSLKKYSSDEILVLIHEEKPSILVGEN